MAEDEIIPLTKEQIPTIVGFDLQSNAYTIGEVARLSSLQGSGKTAVLNFKPAFGAGDKEFGKDKNYWFHYPIQGSTRPGEAYVETFSAKEAALTFLRTLFGDIPLPEKIIVGEPGVREETWLKNFRQHVREVFAELGQTDVEFFYEPFAVFQYYRHVAKLFPVAKHAETVLVVDIGGGTFNSCIIRTTEQGLLARGGALSVALGLQANLFGGAQIDKELLKLLVERTRKKGLAWHDNPIHRIETTKSPALLRIEEAKIKLSKAISKVTPLRLADDFSNITTAVVFPPGECHPDSQIEETLNGEDLKTVIREMWRRHYGPTIIDTMNEATEKLKAIKVSLDRIDKVLVAGGSSRLPFMREEIHTVLPTLVEKENIFKATDTGEAVAYGIACECREQFRRDPKLSVGKIAPFVLSNLYLGFRETRRSPIQVPLMRHDGSELKNGQILSAPFETETFTLEYELEFPFKLSDRVFYVFSDKPIVNNDDVTLINLGNDVFSIPKLKKPTKKCDLLLEINPNGMIKPRFRFYGKGDAISKEGALVECPEFYFSDLQVKEGNSYVGFDFGTSNSYLVRFASIAQEITATRYPEFTLSSRVKERLRELELNVNELRGGSMFTAERLRDHARNQALDFIFHSNKIEGSPLSKGETEDILSSAETRRLSEQEREAKNSQVAYAWMLDNFVTIFDQPEAFTREINRLILQDIKTHAGQYRTESVSLSGTNFTPPEAASVPAFMEQLGEEIKTRGKDRSPVEFAASVHTKLVSIHPFIDGNGRTARLLVNACLLSLGLPVVVVNYADKERYLQCLDDSNEGDLSSTVEFFLDFFQEQLSEFSSVPVLPEAEIDSTTAAPPTVSDSKPDAIDEAIREVRPASPEGPLAAVMREKIRRYQEVRLAEYDAWRQSFLTVLAELKAIAQFFNSNSDYTRFGFGMNLRDYDVLTLEKYEDITSGSRVTKTWFVGLEILGPESRERLLFFFNRASRSLGHDPKTSRVSLAISRFDGNRYQRLSAEPITLREIGYRDGELFFFSKDAVIQSSNVRETLESLLKEVIESYL